MITKVEDPFEHWWSLNEFSERPFVVGESRPFWRKWMTLREAMEEEPSIQREARILKESRRLLAKEIGKKTLPDLESIVAGYARIAESAKDSPQGEVAAKDYQRTGRDSRLCARGIWQAGNSERPEVEVKPETGTGRERFLKNPLVK